MNRVLSYERRKRYEKESIGMDSECVCSCNRNTDGGTCQ